MTYTAASLPLPAGVTVTDAQATAALGLVEAYCGWPLQTNTYTTTLDGDGGPVLVLPSLNVTAVSALTLIGNDSWGNPWPTVTVGVDWDWRTNGVLTALPGGALTCTGWPNTGQSVHVTYTGGYDALPDGVLAVLASVAERVAVQSTIQSDLENVGGIQQNTTYSQSATAGAGLTPIECAVLSRWRIGVVG